MKCEEVQMVLVDYLDNKTDQSLRSEIERHLETCEKCKNELQEFQVVLQAISASRLEEPDRSLRENFNYMLQSETNKIQNYKNQESDTIKRTSFMRWSSPWLKIAASVALLFTGYIVGTKTKPGNEVSQNSQLSELKNEVKEMKEVLMFTMLNEESPSQRIKAVNYAEEIPNPDQKVIGVLVKTLNTDKNVNVRLAAAYSLEKFTNNQPVIDSLVESLDKQTDPIIQVVLINILTEKKEVKAIKPLKKIISDNKSIKEVKDIAKKSLKIIL